MVIGIGGCSGAGKTTLAAELAQRLGATLFPMDLYYRDLAQMPLDSRQERNFDHPDSFDRELLAEHVRALAAGASVQRPVYDRRTHSRVAGSFTTIAPGEYVIVEGILALHYVELLPLYDTAVYVDAPQDVCLARRIARDMRERNRSEAFVREQFDAAVWPMAERYVLPSAGSASLLVQGTEPIALAIEALLERIRTAGPLQSLRNCYASTRASNAD